MNLGASPAKLNEIAVKVWQMILGLGLRPIEHAPGDPLTRDFLMAKVEISGSWRGEILIGCSADLARSAAAVMFGKEPDEATSEDIRDALGELTNMVGGNFKTLLKGDCRLSVPKIVDEFSESQADPDSRIHQWFHCKSGLVLMQLSRQPIA
ncbi:MAG TPA: chemotaxis protein CheX [Polyangiaceae bacterium]|nr:chemotaxis protein CheX [Polyangiaceae bacterium]